MDFKKRFEGKTTHITKDGGIDNMAYAQAAPINKVQNVSTL